MPHFRFTLMLGQESRTLKLKPVLHAAFIETVELKFAARAQEQGCFVASACGFDSIPADIGTIFTQQRFQAPSVPASVESFLTLHTTSGVFRTPSLLVQMTCPASKFTTVFVASAREVCRRKFCNLGERSAWVCLC